MLHENTNNHSSPFRHMVRALRFRNYRLFFFGNGLSLIGTWMTRVATSWLVYRLTQGSVTTKAATVLGIVGFAGQIPMFVLAPFAGVIVDRVNRYHMMIATQILSMLQSLALAYLAWAKIITIPQVIALAAAQGVINAFDVPARQSFVVEMIEDRGDLPNAIALNSSMFNSARLIGPAIGGLLVAAWGEATCFLIDGLSYLAVIAALLAMTVPESAKRKIVGHPLKQLHEGFAYAFGFEPVRAILLLVSLISFTAAAFQVLLPIYADQLKLGGHGAATFGFLLAAIGIGALGGSIYLAARRSVRGLGVVLCIAAALFGVASIGFAFSRSIWLAIPLAMVCGAGMVVHMASANTVLQTIVDDEMRGRLMSFFLIAVMGLAPFGSLAAGAMADRVGLPATIASLGAISILGAAIFTLKIPALRPAVREIYRRKGIIPEVAAG
ncbi:MAG TPA: MFS transporter, partial [Tepidisphaeraceae bacterium]|nr:MFS transporter [Tepidisphaeraceae bacterium]